MMADRPDGRHCGFSSRATSVPNTPSQKVPRDGELQAHGNLPPESDNQGPKAGPTSFLKCHVNLGRRDHGSASIQTEADWDILGNIWPVEDDPG